MSGIFKKFRKDDIQITPFEAHKTYEFTISNYTGSYFEKNYEQYQVFNHTVTASGVGLPMTIRPVSLSAFAYDTQYDGTDFMPDEYGSYLQITKSTPHAVTTNGYLKRSLHDSLQGMYYTNPDDPCWTLDNNGYEKEIRTLGSKAWIISVPQKMFGESIKKGTVSIKSGSKHIIDDGFGNLIDCSLSIANASESINYTSQSLFAMNFADMYNKAGKKINAHSINALASSSYYRDNGKEYYDLKNSTRFFERSPYPNRVEAHGITPTISTSELVVVNLSGVRPTTTESRINKEKSSMMIIKDRHQFDFRTSRTKDNTSADDFSVYVRVSASRFQETASADNTNKQDHNYIISKHDPHREGAYPFSIRYVNENAINSSGSTSIGNAGTYQAAISNGSETLYLNSPYVVSTSNAFNSIVLTKSGSHAYLYVDGVLQSQGSVPSGSTFNKADIVVGAKATDPGTKYKKQIKTSMYSRKYKDSIEYKNHLACGISQIMIFNKVLTQPEVSFAQSNPAFENKVGNVFYNHGLLTFTGNQVGYETAINHIFSECTMSFKNTHTIIEQEYSCHIKEREFGFTMNPTLIDDKKLSTIRTFATGSEWSPYITTIGLYDSQARLLAVGKLSRPIAKSNHYDTTFVVSFDS
jgi:hypothetical protein